MHAFLVCISSTSQPHAWLTHSKMKTLLACLLRLKYVRVHWCLCSLHYNSSIVLVLQCFNRQESFILDMLHYVSQYFTNLFVFFLLHFLVQKLSADHVDTPVHRHRAQDAARQGVVLLKNKNNLLPLNKDKAS